jgi:hypothetical protein
VPRLAHDKNNIQCQLFVSGPNKVNNLRQANLLLIIPKDVSY